MENGYEKRVREFAEKGTMKKKNMEKKTEKTEKKWKVYCELSQ